MSHLTSFTTFAQTPSGGIIRLNSSSPQSQYPNPRTGHHLSPPVSPPMQPDPWASPYQASLSPLGTPFATFDHARTAAPGHDSPPALIWSQSPYATIPLPRQVDVSVSMNPLLKYGSQYLIRYDITTAPGCAVPPPWASYSTASQWLREPVTRPDIRSVAIRMAALDRPIVIQASNNVGVTVYDVLAAVYNAVQAAISSASRHYGHRATAVQALFGNGQILAGLSESPTEPDVWILHVR